MKIIAVFVLVSLLGIAIPVACHAQTFRLKAGMNVSCLNTQDRDQSYNKGRMLKPGFQLGGTAEIRMNHLFSLESGILLMTNGERHTYTEYLSEPFTKVIRTTNLYYLNLPLAGKIYWGHSRMKGYFSMGPYLGIGVYGRQNDETTPSGNLSSKFTIEWGNNGLHNEFRRLDFGWMLNAGIAMKAFQLGVFYHYGMADIQSNDINEARTNTRVAGLSIGYKIY